MAVTGRLTGGGGGCAAVRKSSSAGTAGWPPWAGNGVHTPGGAGLPAICSSLARSSARKRSGSLAAAARACSRRGSSSVCTSQPAPSSRPPHPVVGPPRCLAERAEVVQLQTGELLLGQGPRIQGGPGVRAHLDELQRLVGHYAVGLHDIARHVQVEQPGGHGVHPVTTSRAGQVAEQVGHERDRCIWLVARHLAQVRQQGAQAEQYRGQVTPRLAGAAVRHVRPEARLRYGGGGLVGRCGQAGLRTRRRGGTEHPVERCRLGPAPGGLAWPG